MLLNTGGVRVTEGADGLAAFRFVFKDLLDAKLDGLRVLSLVTHHCFGGGSMLASISDMVLVNPHSQISMSGPKLIQALNQDGGKSFHNAR
jgi:acetyl-CoA carboxylase beta subunit